MYDVELSKEILRQILWSAETIARRFEPITSPEDFVASDAGLEKLDAICMQLIAVGESVKHLDKVTESKLLQGYPQVEWKRIMGMRDVLSSASNWASSSPVRASAPITPVASPSWIARRSIAMQARLV